MTEFSFTKHDEEWGVRVWDGPGSLQGQTVTVSTKGGVEKQVELGELLVSNRRLEIYEIAERKDEPKNGPVLPGPDVVPAGRYAYPVMVDGVEEWRYVKIWRKQDKVAAYAIKGLEKGSKVDRQEALLAIAAFGTGKAAQEFGWRTGYCGRCGDELKKNLSRKLGIGPVCIKKVHSPSTVRSLMAGARKELRDAGLDPEAAYDSLAGV
jgi:hypothetical protein